MREQVRDFIKWAVSLVSSLLIAGTLIGVSVWWPEFILGMLFFLIFIVLTVFLAGIIRAQLG